MGLVRGSVRPAICMYTMGTSCSAGPWITIVSVSMAGALLFLVTASISLLSNQVITLSFPILVVLRRVPIPTIPSTVYPFNNTI